MEGTRGPLVLIGGAEDKIGGRLILNRFVQLAGGPQSRILVIAAASSFEDLVGQRYVSLFGALGAGRIEMLQVRDRSEARHPLPLAQIDNATGIFMTGGDQLKLTALFGGTPIAERLRQRSRAGCVVAGTSAGASVAPEHMLAYGASGLTPRKSMMQFAPGLGLISGLVVDQHFGARNRIGRLMTAVAHNPDLLGIGLDEDTAVEITGSHMSVLGRGAVMVIDGAGVSFSNFSITNEGAPLAIFGLHVHALTSGSQLNLSTRTPLPPSALPPLAEAGLIFGEGI